MFELKNSHKQCNDKKEILKTQFEALKQKVSNLGHASKKNQSDKIHSRKENECQKCRESFISKNWSEESHD